MSALNHRKRKPSPSDPSSEPPKNDDSTKLGCAGVGTSETAAAAHGTTSATTFGKCPCLDAKLLCANSMQRASTFMI
ncbi:hypothetical protein AQUCO_00300071v1 [Aquilegia coerulea]|uniref:Uncharacterized protein n=1 Tax=Aquilegia coerulea TaxID=218851 RepID=A0A2G5EX65_AQUCA|nr:hypothetical protein AQUCO_00300071v1 [Aquilegia coerulea]